MSNNVAYTEITEIIEFLLFVVTRRMTLALVAVMTVLLVEGGLRVRCHLRKVLRVLRHPELLTWLVRYSHQYHRYHRLFNFWFSQRHRLRARLSQRHISRLRLNRCCWGLERWLQFKFLAFGENKLLLPQFTFCFFKQQSQLFVDLFCLNFESFSLVRVLLNNRFRILLKYFFLLWLVRRDN